MIFKFRLFFCGLLLLTLLMEVRDVFDLFFWIIGAVIVAVPILIFYPQLTVLMSKPLWKRNYIENRELIINQRITLKDEGIENIDAQITEFVKYKAIGKILYNAGCFYVYIGTSRAWIIPLSSFMGQCDPNAFIGMLCNKTGLSVISN